MSKPSVPRKAPKKEAPAFTLADVTITHAVGNKVETLTGNELAGLLNVALSRNYAPNGPTYIELLTDPSSIACDLQGLSALMRGLVESEEVGGAASRGLDHLADQLERAAHRVGALARIENMQADWYRVAVRGKR